MTKRFRIRFPSQAAMKAARAIETPNATETLHNDKRGYIALEVTGVADDQTGPDAIQSAMERVPEIRQFVETYGAEVVEDYQFDLDDGEFSFEDTTSTAFASLSEVTEMINAPGAWMHTTGKGATIAIVDTGIDGSHPEFPAWKKAGNWEPTGHDPWTDWQGHGTMCATICAADDRPSGGRYRGVAPDAKLIACKTRFYESELAAIYDYLADLAPGLDGPLIASNSFGYKTGKPPTPPGQSDFIDALNDAITAGVHVFFSAGNNHQRAGGAPSACDPNSIWLHKSRADVFPVATCDLERKIWYYSSRGPGQFHGLPISSMKPDVTAPTPRNGKILYGSGERVMPNGWGTSGACPQAAGLAALLVGVDKTLTRDQVFGAIRDNARPIGYAQTCEGAGVIDCAASVEHVLSLVSANSLV